MRFVLGVLVVAACGDNHHHDDLVLLVSPTQDLHTSEAGSSVQFGVALNQRPTGTVTSINPGEGVVAPAELDPPGGRVVSEFGDTETFNVMLAKPLERRTHGHGDRRR